MTSLADKMKNRPPNPAQWSKAFGGTKCVDGRSGGAENTFTVDEPVKLVRETKEAALFIIGKKQEWVPKSQIVASSNTALTVTMWLARERGWTA